MRLLLGFQSTRPRGARRADLIVRRCKAKFQSTRPRGARLLHRGHFARGAKVSIHAPAWGATVVFPVLLSSFPQFQSTRPRGARRKAKLGGDHKSEFQSTRPRGARLQRNGYRVVIVNVSIHAPAWGATNNNTNTDNIGRVSIHAPAWGATPALGIGGLDE